MSRRRPFDRARRRIGLVGGRSGERLAPRLDRAARRLNPYLLAVAIGLAVLYLTFLVAIRVAPPGPLPAVRALHSGSTTLAR
jgi:uncharacterized RDD family membrane protein YckC